MAPMVKTYKARLKFLSARAFLLAVYGALYASEWQVQVIDPAAGGAKYSTLLVDKAGNAHASYFNENTRQLKYAFWDHALAKWLVMTVDEKVAGFASMALDSKQRPHIAYLEYGTQRLKYAFWDGTSWKIQTIELKAKLVEFYTSIALDLDDQPVISFYEVLNSSGDVVLQLRYIRRNGALWETRTIDSSQGSGKFNSIRVGPHGSLHAAYANVKDETATPRYARWNGKSWDTEILEQGAGGRLLVYSVSMIVDLNDVPHITYTDVPNRLVKYATRQGGKWQLQVVDAVAKEGYPDRNGIALDSLGNPYLSYYDAGLGLLKVARRKDQQWLIETVDQDYSGFNSSLQVDQNSIWVIYAGDAGAVLKCARTPLEPGSLIGQQSSTSLSRH
jgi:hypothetical protein